MLDEDNYIPTPPEFDPDEVPDVMEYDDSVEKFFDVAARMGDLYVSYRQRFVMMVDGNVFVPKHSKTGYLKLLNKSIYDHLNRKYCISVYAGPHSAKFLCFDVDEGGLEVVRKIVDYILDLGIPKEAIAVSTSGSKGYHVEIFFDGVTYTLYMSMFYGHVIDRLGLDPHKVEFRPTKGQSIKLPLSVHYKTKKVCWYLDLDTFEPICSINHILTFKPMSREEFCMIVDRLPIPKCAPDTSHGAYLNERVFHLDIDGDHYPDLQEEGNRFHTMRSIAIYERNQGKYSPEELEQRLRDWVDRQNPDYITDPRSRIDQDIKGLVDWVFSPGFKLHGKRSKGFELTKSDVALCLAQGTKMARRVMFVLVCYAKRYGSAKLGYEAISKFAGCSVRMAKNVVESMVASGYLTYDRGRGYMKDNKLVLNVNTYHPNLDSTTLLARGYDWLNGSIQVTEEFSHDEGWFVKFYYKVLAEMVEARSLASVLTASEIKEMKELTENGKRFEQDDQ